MTSRSLSPSLSLSLSHLNTQQAMGSETTAHGYASSSLGEGTTSSTWGETALGLFTEAAGLSEEEQRNASVIPVVGLILFGVRGKEEKRVD